jgi:hypothetical protein
MFNLYFVYFFTTNIIMKIPFVINEMIIRCSKEMNLKGSDYSE